MRLSNSTLNLIISYFQMIILKYSDFLYLFLVIKNNDLLLWRSLLNLVLKNHNVSGFTYSVWSL